MLIKLQCKCGQILKAKPEFAGKTLPCPKCSKPVVVPIPEPDPIEDPEPDPAPEQLVFQEIADAVSSPPPLRSRSGANGWLPLILSIASLAVSIACASMILRARDPLGTGLKFYDLSTPEKSLRSQLQMAANLDLRALHQLSDIKQSQTHKLATLKVHRQAEYKGTIILFVSHDVGGIEKREVQGLEKDAHSGVWIPSYVSSYGMDDEKLKKSISEWNSEP